MLDDSLLEITWQRYASTCTRQHLRWDPRRNLANVSWIGKPPVTTGASHTLPGNFILFRVAQHHMQRKHPPGPAAGLARQPGAKVACAPQTEGWQSASGPQAQAAAWQAG